MTLFTGAFLINLSIHGFIRYKSINDKKLVCENDTVFALHQETGDVFVLNGRIPMARHSLDATDFVVVGFNIYYLSDTKLMRFHLFTLEKEVILNHIVSFERLNHQLICQTEAKKSVFVNLNK